MSTNSSDYISNPSYAELLGICLIGAAHVITEMATSEAVGFIYNAVASATVIFYLVWRGRSATGAARMWGMRTDNFIASLRALAVFAIPGALGLLVLGVILDSLYLPWGFWLTLALYPIWGTAQQFALQNLVARNVAGRVSSPVAVAAISTTLFASSHYPRLPLMGLTLLSGFFLTLIYRKQPNLWAVGLVHGALGSLAVYIVLQEDPGMALWRLAGM